jgi:hypothetical protein
LDSCAETGGEAAPMCACDFLLEKREYYVHIKKCIHLLFNFSLRHFSISVLSEAVYEKKFLWKKALLSSPKHCQNGKNSMADNLTLTDPNGKVRNKTIQRVSRGCRAIPCVDCMQEFEGML